MPHRTKSAKLSNPVVDAIYFAVKTLFPNLKKRHFSKPVKMKKIVVVNVIEMEAAKLQVAFFYVGTKSF